MFLRGPNKRLTHFAMGFSRKHLHIITGLLTGHIALNRHLTLDVSNSAVKRPALKTDHSSTEQLGLLGHSQYHLQLFNGSLVRTG